MQHTCVYRVHSLVTTINIFLHRKTVLPNCIVFGAGSYTVLSIDCQVFKTEGVNNNLWCVLFSKIWAYPVLYCGRRFRRRTLISEPRSDTAPAPLTIYCSATLTIVLAPRTFIQNSSLLKNSSIYKKDDICILVVSRNDLTNSKSETALSLKFAYFRNCASKC
jgi:hypothetical protein